MATATLNPIFISISGRIDNFVFYRRKETQCIRMYVVPRNPDTISQRNVRRSFANAVKSWQAFTNEERYKYTRRSRGMNMSGYNFYISKFIKENISVGSRPEIKLLSMDLLNSSGVQRRIHSVSPSLLNPFCTLTAVRELYLSPGLT